MLNLSTPHALHTFYKLKIKSRIVVALAWNESPKTYMISQILLLPRIHNSNIDIKRIIGQLAVKSWEVIFSRHCGIIF